VTDGGVDGDSRTSVLRPQYVRREDVVVIQNLLSFKLTHLHRLGAFIPQNLLGTHTHTHITITITTS